VKHIRFSTKPTGPANEQRSGEWCCCFQTKCLWTERYSMRDDNLVARLVREKRGEGEW